MWITHEPKKVALWNKWHFEEKNGECAACLKYSVLIVVEKIYKTQHLGGSGTPVLYIGRTILKGWRRKFTCNTLLLKFMQFIYWKPKVKWAGHGIVRLGMGSAIHLLSNYVPPVACCEVTFTFLCSVKEISMMMSFIHSSTTSRLIQLSQIILLSYIQ
jgi:hypothetical protein